MLWSVQYRNGLGMCIFEEACSDGVICVLLCVRWRLPAVTCRHGSLTNLDSEQERRKFGRLHKWMSMIFACPVIFAMFPWLLCRCAVEVVCLPPPRHGVVGTAGSTSPRSATPCAQPLLLQPCPPWSWLRVRLWAYCTSPHVNSQHTD